MCDVCGNVPEWLKGDAEEHLIVTKKRKPKTAPAASMKRPPERDADRPPERPAPDEDVPFVRTYDAPRPAPAERVALGQRADDRDLVEYFKEWRRRTAQRASVPAYVVLSDAALEDLCRKRPANLRELLAVTGIGERKAELYGSEIFAALEGYRQGARAAVREVAQSSPADETMRLLAEGKSFEEIAEIRGRQLSTVVNMVADLVEKGRLEYKMEWVGEDKHRQIEEVVRRIGPQWLKPLREALPPEITYDQIRLVVAYVRFHG